MKKILFILLLLPFFAESQTYQSMPQAGYGPVKRMLFDSVLTIPLSITSLRNISGGRDVGQLRYNVADSSPYIYSGYQWIKIGGGTGSSQWTDVTGGINYSGGKVGIGTSTPVYKFDVNGTAGATDLEITNSVNVGNGVSTGGILHADGNLETQDSVKFTNLTSKVLDTTNYKPLVIGSTGNVHKTNWFGSGGSSNAWSLEGNGATTSANFIGTTDNKPLVFKVNGNQIGKFGTNNGFSFGAGSNASGYASTAGGYSAIASGDGAVSLGTETTASGVSSTSFGDGTIASGAKATSFGKSSISSGSYSTSFGYYTTASGNYSTAIGASTVSSGYISTAIGLAINSKSYAGIAIGARNDTTDAVSSTSFDLQNRAFQIGIGDGSNTQGQNAMTVLFNGNTGIGTTTPTATLHNVGTLRIQDGNEANGKVLTSDANGNATWQTAGGSSITTFQVISDADTTLTNVQASYLFTDLSANRDITMPNLATDGTEITIKSYNNNLPNKTLTIYPYAGYTIEGLSSGYVLSVNSSVTFKLYDNAVDWQIIDEKL